MTPNDPRSGEFATIANIFAPLTARAPGAMLLRDDVATLDVPPGRELVVTTDTLVEGVHFFHDDPADTIAAKALRVNLSDLVAKGARPEGYVLALSLAPWVDDVWLRRFADGLAADQTRYDVSLLGGDTTATPGPLTLTITAFGSIEIGRTIRRVGAMAGDAVFVTGTIGDAGAGLAVLRGAAPAGQDPHRQYLVERYRCPEPRLAFGAGLVGLAKASLDVSDGLLADLGHIAAVSEVRVIIEAGKIPLSEAYHAVAGRGPPEILRAATAGDDYEIAFTAPETAVCAIMALGIRTDTPVSRIGRVEAGQGVTLLDEAGQPVALDRLGYTHF